MNYDLYEITNSYSIQEFFISNNKKIRKFNKYITDDYGVPTLKIGLLFGHKWVGLGESVINESIDSIISNPENYQIVELTFNGGKPFYRIAKNNKQETNNNLVIESFAKLFTE